MRSAVEINPEHAYSRCFLHLFHMFHLPHFPLFPFPPSTFSTLPISTIAFQWFSSCDKKETQCGAVEKLNPGNLENPGNPGNPEKENLEIQKIWDKSRACSLTWFLTFLFLNVFHLFHLPPFPLFPFPPSTLFTLPISTFRLPMILKLWLFQCDPD